MPESSDLILIPTHNRRDISLAALGRLAADRVLDWATVIVIDDGSKDGTAEDVRERYPTVDLLRGDGTWWWGGAIRRGMEAALARAPERIWWLNDDCMPPAGALAALRDFVAREGCVAWITARAPSGWDYGAQRKTAWRIRRCTRVEEAAGEIDTFSGNCVCLPAPWVRRVGLPDDRSFPHGLADFDYGLRLRAAGANLRPLPNRVAQSNEPAAAAAESWLASARPMRDIWRDFRSPRSFLYFPAWRRFALKYWGPVWGWAVFSAPYVRWSLIAAAKTVAPGLVRRLRSRRRSADPTAASHAAGD